MGMGTGRPRRPGQRAPPRGGGGGLGGGFSDFEIHSDETDEEGSSSGSFYERHGLAPPPLASKAQRAGARRALAGDGPTRMDPLSGLREGEAATSAATGTAEATITTTGLVAGAADWTFAAGTGIVDPDPATLLRRDLLYPYYDRHAYPWEYAWRDQPQGARTGVPVEMSINFHRIFSLDVVNPVMDLVAWLRIEWSDPRLTWRPEEYGNLTKIWFWIGDGGSGGETSEIWTPDIELWNLEEGLRDSFDDAYAKVEHDGTVWWSRPGHLRPACKYYGLQMFPFDSLMCKMEFGSWAYSGKYMRLVKGHGNGYTVGGSETAGSSFNEFSFAEEDPIKCDVHVYPPYPSSPEEDWPVLIYEVKMERSWQPFVRGYITMQILLNIVGFSAFWLPPSCGERMGLSITAMLAAVASEIVIAEDLPAAREYTWFQKFSLLSMGFAFVSLIECVAVLYFYYKRSEDMIPLWFTKVHKWYVVRAARKQARKFAQETVTRGSIMATSCSNALLRRNSSDVLEGTTRDPKLDDKDSFSDDDALERNRLASVQEELPSLDKTMNAKRVRKDPGDEALESTARMTMASAHTKGQEGKEDKKAAGESIGSINGSLHSMGSLDADFRDTDKGNSLRFSSADFGVINTEKTFHDSTISNITMGDDICRSNNLKPTKRARQGVRRGEQSTKEPQPKKVVSFSDWVNEGDEMKSRRKLNLSKPDNDAKNRRSSLDTSLPSRKELMEDFRQNRNSESLRSFHSILAPRDADDFHDEQELENNMKWKHVAAGIDQFARFWIPFAFAIALAIVLSEVN